MLLSHLVLSFGLLCVIDAATLPMNLHIPIHFSHNATLHRRNNINKYGGCDKQYDNGKGKDIVYQAYQDMLKVTQLVNPFLKLPSPSGPGGNEPDLPPGVLEDRFFGPLADQTDKLSLIHGQFCTCAIVDPWAVNACLRTDHS